MLSTLPGMLMPVSLTQLAKAFCGIAFSPLPIVAVVRLRLLRNASAGMLVTWLPMVSLVKPPSAVAP